MVSMMQWHSELQLSGLNNQEKITDLSISTLSIKKGSGVRNEYQWQEHKPLNERLSYSFLRKCKLNIKQNLER